MIVRNVEKFIGSCLESIAPFVNEVVIVDTGSTDGTKTAIDRAVRYGDVPSARILDFTPETHPQGFYLDAASSYEPETGPFTEKPFLSDFAAARNLGWQRATSDYILWVDSDDIVVGSDKLASVVADMVANKRDTAFLNYDYLTDEKGRVILQHQRERIFRRAAGAAWVGRVHEVCIPPGNSHFYPDLKIVHKRREYGLVPEVNHRNLKILVPWLKTQNPVDPRTLFYLATEECGVWPDRAVKRYQEYAAISGSPDERSTAHNYVGEIYEKQDKLDAALAAYAQAVLANPTNPDGYFGAARIAYFKARKGLVSWYEVIDQTERGLAIAKSEAAPTMVANPTARASKPYVYYSVALINTEQFQKGVAAAEEGLKHFEADTDEHAWLTHNRQHCLDRLRSPTKTLHAVLRLDDPLETPSCDIPHEMLVGVALQLWKKTREAGNAANAAQLLASLPPALSDDLKIRAAKNFAPPADKKLTIVIWTGPSYEKWSPKNLDTGIGGSENAAIYMARALHKLGHDVSVYNDCREDAGIYDGVKYIHYTESHPFAVDVLIVSRIAPIVKELGGNAKLRVLWVHDVHCGSGNRVAVGLGHADRILCLSQWHKEDFCRTYPGLNQKAITITRNGLDLDRFKKAPEKIGNRLIFSSSPDRGLDLMLDLFPKIRDHVPDAELHVFYGFKFWESVTNDHGTAAARTAHYKQRMAATHGVVFHGRVGQQTLADAFLAAKVWSYPTWFDETSCLGAAEAQAAGCVPVTTIEGALPETVKHGILIPQPSNDARYAEAFVANCVHLLTNEAARAELASQGRAHAQSLSWTAVAAEWENLFKADLADLSTARHLPALRTETTTSKPLRIAVILGKSGAPVHGILDINEICDTGFRTGTVLGFLGIAWGLAERGHTIDAFCDAKERVTDTKWGGANFYPLDSSTVEFSYDAYISVNEPDLLRPFPRTSLRVCVQWLNDFSYCSPGWDAYVDQYVLPSETLRQYLGADVVAKSAVIPIGTNVEFFTPEKPKRPGSVAYCSSPDRGLHHLLRIWPRIRLQEPNATLRVYYRFQPWYDEIMGAPTLIGTPVQQRAVEIHAALAALKDQGVTLVGPVPPKTLAAELSETQVLAYPCDTVRFSEGYSVSILDACAAGCVPIISGVDALPEVYAKAVRIIPGKPDESNYDAWVKAIVEAFRTPDTTASLAHAQRHRRQDVAKLYEDFLYSKVTR